MISLPKEIVHMIKTIEDAGYEAYAVGGCVRDSILGRHPEDWDLTSNASRETLEALFPGAVIVNKKLGVMRITEDGITADIAAFRIDGEYKDYRRPETVIFTGEISEDLRRRDFTMNAIGVSPYRGVVDPYHGREDIRNKVIRGIGDPRVRFEEDALRILRGIRFSAQLDFTIDPDTLQAIKEKAVLLSFISIERVREEYVKLVTAANSGKGLALLMETGVLPHILGEYCVKNAEDEEWKRFTELLKQIGHADSALSFRLALIYRCFKTERALTAIDRMGYSNDMKKRLRCAVGMAEEFRGIRSKAELKSFLSRVGTEMFRFLADLSEQECRMDQADQASHRLISKLFNEIQNNREPVFPEDLAVNGNDLIAAGVAEGTEVGRILRHLLETVRREPERNEKGKLLEIAERIRCRENDRVTRNDRGSHLS